MTDSVVSRVGQQLDQLKAMLRDCIRALPDESVARIIENLELDFYTDKDLDGGERFEVHAMLVGILTVMVETIEAKEADRD